MRINTFSKLKKLYSPVDIDLRYHPIVSFLKKHLDDKPNILDVGSSGYGIAKYLKYPITGLDVDFGEEISEYLTPVYQKGKKFPFPDKKFDFVVNVDTLEHIPKKDRYNFVSELIRVSRKSLLIAAPCGKLSEKQDKYFYDYFFRNHGKKDIYLDEHVKNGLSSVEDVTTLIRKNCTAKKRQCTVSVHKNVNLKFRKFYMMLLMSNSTIHKNIFRSISVFNPVWRFFNFGDCYRYIFIVDIS